MIDTRRLAARRSSNTTSDVDERDERHIKRHIDPHIERHSGTSSGTSINRTAIGCKERRASRAVQQETILTLHDDQLQGETSLTSGSARDDPNVLRAPK